ncbi:MAG: Ig-like domain-containing protein [Deltaproteobacteria bacterium]|nr:Ig-like domain-containing protein [Deltaproteobacteria bacterium]
MTDALTASASDVLTRLGRLAAALVLACTAVGCTRPPAELAIDPAQLLTMDKKGKTAQLKVQTRDERHVFQEWVQAAWSSDDESVARVSDGGLVEATGSGKTNINATYNGLKASIPVTVRIVGSVAVDPPGPIKMKLYKKMQFKATVKNDKGQPLADENVRWTRTTVEVDVDQQGNVSAEATGDTELIAKAKDKEGRVKIVVTPP